MYFTKKQREYYNLHRQKACDALGISVNTYNMFRRYGQKLHAIYENQCNGYMNTTTWKEDTQARDADEREEQVITDEVQASALNCGLHVYFQTDPRGATIYLDTKPIAYDRYTDAYCIY